MKAGEKQFLQELVGPWAKDGLTIDVFAKGGPSFVCPRCIPAERLTVTTGKAACEACSWEATGSAESIAKAAAALRSGALDTKEGDAGDDLPPFIDLGALARAGLPREKPQIAPAFDDKCLLYAGRLNEIHAEPSVGKTNVACAFVVSVVRAGGMAVFLDPEDIPQGIAAKLLSFGLSDSELSDHVRYIHNPEPEVYGKVQRWCRKHPCALVVLDGLAEALAAESLSEDVPGDILPFFRDRLRPFAEAGAAVLISDHVAKNPETRGRWARGSGAKLGRYDGAVYALILGGAYTPQTAGFVRLIVAKDRVGGVGTAGQIVAELHFSPQGGNTRIEWKPPEEKGSFMPTGIMVKICDHLRLHPNATYRDLRGLGNSGYVDLAIKKLKELGHIDVISAGPRKRTYYELLEPFTGENG